MDLKEALEFKKVEIAERDGYDLIPSDYGSEWMVKKWRTKKRPATVEDVISWDPVKGIIVTVDGQKIKIFE